MTRKTEFGCSVGCAVALGVLVIVVGMVLWQLKREFLDSEQRDVILMSAVYDE